MKLLLFVALAGCGFSSGGVPAAAVDARELDARGTPPEGDGRPIDAPGPACPGGDVDHDGVCDDADAWSCGPGMPSGPGSSVTHANGLGGGFDADRWTTTLTMVNGGGPIVNARGGSPLALHVDWSMKVLFCGFQTPSCKIQLEYGLVAGGRVGCTYDANTTASTTAAITGTIADSSIVLPNVTGPTEIDVRLNVGRRSSCSAMGGGWFGTPGDDQTVARICVVP